VYRIFNSRRFFLFWCSAGNEGETDRRSFGYIFETLDTFYFAFGALFVRCRKFAKRDGARERENEEREREREEKKEGER
jgi:hypothetical protein